MIKYYNNHMAALQDQAFPDYYIVPFNIHSLIPNFNINDFMSLLEDKCAAFVIEDSLGKYQVIFNTYNFMHEEDMSKMSLVDVFRHSIEQRKRSLIVNDWSLVLNKKPIFMVIYMHSHDGYRVGATLKKNGTYEFGAFASPEFIKVNKIQT